MRVSMLKRAALFLALTSLAACGTTWSTRLELGPNGNFSHTGGAGEVEVVNRGPGTIEVTAEHEDGSRLVNRLAADSQCEFELVESDKLRILNDSEQSANIRVRVEED